ncbi:hypothetical protein SY88_14725 [Clostridiales bacterium PH28_bin88]|nr:hypothetical protein SY88_14725 [Clostridiales bacterium PH28_bin88]
MNSLYQQMFQLRKQIIDKYVEGGEITPEQAKGLKDNLDYMEKYQRENGYGFGMMGSAGHCGGDFSGTDGTQPAPSGYGYGWGMMGGNGMMY